MVKLIVMFSCILIAMVIVSLVDLERLESVYLRHIDDDISSNGALRVLAQWC